MAAATFERIKPGINREEVRDIQRRVNTIFCDFSDSATPSAESFLEFSDKGIQAQAELLFSFEEEVRKSGVKGVINAAFELGSKGARNSRLVQSTLAIFLTHDKEARRMGVAVPPLALQSSFKRARTIRPAPSPVTPDTLLGPGVIAYFREDYDLNDHHKHWHVVFPVPGIPLEGRRLHAGEKICNRRIKRQGELFLYMHSQMLARYNAELHGWGMDPLDPWTNYHEIERYGYTPPPGLQDQYSTRPANEGWYEENNPDIDDDIPPIADLEGWRYNMLGDLARGKFRTTNLAGESGEYELTEENSMNTVGFVLEALSEKPRMQEVTPGVSTDRNAYGSLHNNGHNKFSEIGAYYEDVAKLDVGKKPGKKERIVIYGVMGDTAAAVRDHIFWRWHRHIDDFRRIIQSKYSHDVGEFKPDAEIVELEIVSRLANSTTPQNGLATYLTPPNTDRNEVNAKLRHEPYEWRVKVRSTRTRPKIPQNFTVRLFIVIKDLLPDLNSWIEMDKFTVCLSQEEDTFVRKDTDSSVARKVKPFSSDSRCSCGWPQNLMLPVGNREGLPYLAFAMLTNDQLGQDDQTHSLSFCGVEDDDYPDPRGMGYPINKKWTRLTKKATIKDIVDANGHMKLAEFKIYRYIKTQVDIEELKEGDLVVAFNNWMNLLEGK